MIIFLLLFIKLKQAEYFPPVYLNCVLLSLRAYLRIYLAHRDKQQKREHGIESGFYEVKRDYRGDEHFDNRLNTGAHEDSGKDEVERYHNERHQNGADRKSRRHAFFAADFFIHQTRGYNQHARRAEVHDKAYNVAR